MNNITLNWQTIAHTLVGMIIVGTQMAAGEFSTNVALVAYCHIIGAVVAQMGVGLGVWQVASGIAARRALLAANCSSCGKPAFENKTEKMEPNKESA